MDKLDKEIAVENMINTLSMSIEEIEKLLSFMVFYDDTHRDRVTTAFKIINKKISKLKKCETLDEAKKYIKLKKVVKRYENK